MKKDDPQPYPEKLSRYFASHSVETLSSGLLKVSRITSFNDPFEFMYRATGSLSRSQARAHMRKHLNSERLISSRVGRIPGINSREDWESAARQHLGHSANELRRNLEFAKRNISMGIDALADDNFRVLCFTGEDVAPTDEIVIWSHYADSHRGVRMIFQFPNEIHPLFELQPVKYRQERIVFDFTLMFDTSDGAANRILKDAFLIKNLSWSYEDEHRAVLGLLMCELQSINGRNEAFFRFKPEWLIGVDFGCRCPESLIMEIQYLLDEQYPHVLYRKAEPHSTDYALFYRTLKPRRRKNR